MLHGDTISAFRSWEERFPVASWVVDGPHVWPLVRADLAARILAAGRPPTPGGRPFPRARLRGVLGVARSAAGAMSERASEFRRIPQVDAVFLSSPANRSRLGGIWYDRLFDPIADMMDEHGFRSLVLEVPVSRVGDRVPRHRPARTLAPEVFLRRLRAALLPLRVPKLEGYDEFVECLGREYPAVRAPTPRRLAAQSRAVESLAALFDPILAEAAPRLALCSCYYTLLGMAFCLAASRRGIRSVDVQHGVTVRNPAYEGWTQFPEGGYAMLPDRFWCWCQEDAQPVAAWPERARPHHQALVAGHPWLAFWRTEHPLTSDYLRKVRGLRGASLNVLVSLTWSSGFSEVLERLLRGSPRDWTWWIRLHPVMERERLRIRRWCVEHVGGRAHVDGPTDLPLPLLLRQADVHLTHNSTVVQEAAALGTPSVVIDRRSLDVYTDELESGWAAFADEPAAIFEALSFQSRRRRNLSRRRSYPAWQSMTEVVRGMLEVPSARAS